MAPTITHLLWRWSGGGSNITAFRLVDPNNLLVMEVVRYICTVLYSYGSINIITPFHLV